MNATFDLKGVSSLISHVARIEASASKFDLAVVQSMAAEAKKVIVSSASPRRLSRWNDGQGLTLNASYKISPTPIPTVIVRGTPPGVWTVLESGASKHLIGNRVAGVGTTRSGRARRGKRNQSGGFLGRPGVFAATAPVVHPGVPGKHTWSRSAEAAIAVNRATIGTVRRTEYVKFFAGV